MRWLYCVAQAVVKSGVHALANLVPFGNVLHDIAKEAWEDHRRRRLEDAVAAARSPEVALAADLEEVAQASPAAVEQAVAQVVHSVAANQPAPVQQALTAYLAQVPAMVHRSLRRPSDPGGTTVPASLSLRQPADVLPLLPPKLPRFKAGDRPLPGVPWMLEEMLGVGGFGEVWRAQHRSDPSLKVALKFCLDEGAARSLRHEAKVLSRVRSQGRHPGIVELRQIYDENDPFCLEYEYVEGGDLCGLIRELHASGPPAPGDVARWMLNLLEPVSFVHRLKPPLVHRDLKPANILVERREGGEFRLRVADFGISDQAAQHAIREGTSSQSLTIGWGGYTLLYASPQQVRGESGDPRDDVHALGVIWYQMLTGDLGRGRPSGSGWKRTLTQRGMSSGLIDLLEACMDDEVDVRPADAAEMTKLLGSLLQARAEKPTTESVPSPPRRESTAPKAAGPQRTPGELLTLSIPVRVTGRKAGESFTLTIPSNASAKRNRS
jgi:eukaryotic-like serine/threonine-protein kinase